MWQACVQQQAIDIGQIAAACRATAQLSLLHPVSTKEVFDLPTAAAADEDRCLWFRVPAATLVQLQQQCIAHAAEQQRQSLYRHLAAHRVHQG